MMKLVNLRPPILLVMVAVVVAFSLLTNAVRASAPAQIPDCGGAKVFIEGGQPSPFMLPDFAGGKLQVDPSTVLEIRAENIPQGARLNWSLRGFGTKLASKDLDIGAGVAQVRIDDFSGYARGIFQIDGTVLNEFGELCTVPFELDISGFGGTIALAATGVSAVAGLGALASAPLAANGINAKAKLKVQVQRRRPRGLRRWLPVPAWKRTVFSTITGIFMGLGVAVLLQQSGFAPLSMATALKGAIIGGGVTFGVGYSLGVLLTFLKPPLPPPDEQTTV